MPVGSIQKPTLAFQPTKDAYLLQLNKPRKASLQSSGEVRVRWGVSVAVPGKFALRAREARVPHGQVV